MRALREFKTEVALLTALADLGGVWPVLDGDGRADRMRRCGAARCAVDFLFREAAARGHGSAEADGSAARRGYIVLAMGKYGAGELNYSSDIDLIVFYDRDAHPLARRRRAARRSSCA